MNPTMNQRKQTTERSKMREQNFHKEALKRRIALLEEENGILKQAEIAERANNAEE
jgi:hypothetical protein